LVTGIFSETACTGGGASYQSFAAKLDVDGSILWQQSYGGSGDDELFTVRERPNGQLWYYGWQRDGGNPEPWLLVTNANGDPLTSYTGNTLGDGFGYGFDLTADGGFITIGYDDSIYARKFDENVDLVWQRSLGIPSGGLYFRAFETLDKNYAFLACLDGSTGCNSHLFKINTQGDIVWVKNWNGLLREVCEYQPGQFILTGYTNNFPVLPEALVVRFDTIFDSIPNSINHLEQSIELTIYPNPAQSSLYISSSELLTQITLYSLDGQERYHQQTEPTNHVALPLPELAQGVYLLKIETISGHVLFRKMQVLE
jgi:hypothetical protein